MTLRLILALTFAVAAHPAAGQGVQETLQRFDEGNRLYRAGNYQAALDAYEAALETGFESGALYYNMANAHYRLDALGQAVRYYAKAEPLMADSPELAHNLEILRQQTLDQFSRLPDPFWRPPWDWLVGVVTPAGIFFIGLLFYIVGAGAAALRIRHGRSPWVRRAMTAGLLVGAIFVMLGFAASFEVANTVRAVVLADEVELLDRPDGSNAELVVHEGTIVDVVTERAAWSEVRLPNGARGWMLTEAYGTI